MARHRRLSSLPALLLAALILLVTCAHAIKFDLSAYPSNSVDDYKKCISQFVSSGTMVLITVKVDEGYNQRVDLEINDNSPARNQYVKQRDVNEARLALNTHADADVIICFTNTLSDGTRPLHIFFFFSSGFLLHWLNHSFFLLIGFNPDSKYKRVIDVDFDVGAEAMDYSAIAKSEKLQPIEAELRKLEKVVQEIWDEMEYLKNREAKMRDTNG